MQCITNNVLRTKIDSLSLSGNSNESIPLSTFSHKSKTRKNWTNHTIPTGCNAQISSFGGKTLINEDKLHLKINVGLLPEIQFDSDGLYELSDHYHLEVEPFGGMQYHNKAKVYYSKEMIGYVLWGPRFATLANTAKYEIENAQLYDTINMDVWPELIIENFLKSLQSEVIEVFQTDICFDGESIIQFMEAARDRIITPVRQKSYEKHDMRTDPITGAVKGFSFGSRSSGRYVRVYDKTRELRDKYPNGEKKYIPEFWIANNLVNGPDMPRVGRLEIELKGKFLKTIKDFHYTDLFDRKKLAKIAEIALSGWFDWVPTEHTDSKLNRRPRVEILDFSQVKTDGYVRQRPEKGQSTRTEKIMVKRLVLDAAKTDNEPERITYLKAAANICERALLHTWLSMKSHDIKTEIRRRARIQAYEVPEEILSSCLADLIAEVNTSFAPVALVDSLGIYAGELVEA